MEKLFSNIEELRKILSEDNFDKEVAIEFLDAIYDNAVDAEESIDGVNQKLKGAEEENTELEHRMQEMIDEPSWNVIDTGLGEIRWSADSLKDILMMEDISKKYEGRGMNIRQHALFQ